jgi:thioredoxin-related protein
MKKLIALTALLGLSSGMFAGEGWLTNLEKAKALAKKEKKMILVEFTGSDWCPPCIALKKNVFNQEAFKKYAKANLVLVEFDFPKNKSKISKEQQDYNNTQKKKFGIRGYPSVYLLDANGKELLKKVGYGRGTTCDSYIKALKNAKFQ